MVQGDFRASKPSMRHLPDMNAETRLSPKVFLKISGHCDFSISLTLRSFFMLSKNPNRLPLVPSAMSRPNTTTMNIHPRMVIGSSWGRSFSSMFIGVPLSSEIMKVSFAARTRRPSP